MWGLIPLIIGVVLIGIGVWITIKWWGKIAFKCYKGKVVFKSNKEYADFKLAVGGDKVISFSADVLSSEPPIVAEFEVKTNPDCAFPYGKEEVVSKSEVSRLPQAGLWTLGGVLIIMGIAVMTA